MIVFAGYFVVLLALLAPLDALDNDKAKTTRKPKVVSQQGKVRPAGGSVPVFANGHNADGKNLTKYMTVGSGSRGGGSRSGGVRYSGGSRTVSRQVSHSYSRPVSVQHVQTVQQVQYVEPVQQVQYVQQQQQVQYVQQQPVQQVQYVQQPVQQVQYVQQQPQVQYVQAQQQYVPVQSYGTYGGYGFRQGVDTSNSTTTDPPSA